MQGAGLLERGEAKPEFIRSLFLRHMEFLPDGLRRDFANASREFLFGRCFAHRRRHSAAEILDSLTGVSLDLPS